MLPTNRYLLVVSALCCSALVLFSTTCSRRPSGPRDRLEYFKQNLQDDMDTVDLKKTFGPAEKLTHSDLSIYKYHLADSTEVWIGYTDKIVYACYVDKRHNLVEDIIHR